MYNVHNNFLDHDTTTTLGLSILESLREFSYSDIKGDNFFCLFGVEIVIPPNFGKR
jgi:hypothetical protein